MNRVVILGGGESGTGSAVLAKLKGFDTFLSDITPLQPNYRALMEKYSIIFEEGKHTKDLILNADLIIKSPGIPDSVPIVEEAIKYGIPIISEIEFAGRYDNSKKICITGSNGKTTTTSVIYYLMKNAGLNVGLGGNIGTSYALQVATENFDYYVLELSSFQLDGMYDFKADVAVLLNITPDHLDRYDYKIDKYIKAKFRITQNMSEKDCFIFCQDDELTVENLDKIVSRAKQLPFTQQIDNIPNEGAWLEESEMVVKYGDNEYRMLIEELSLQGKHNVYNSMAAAITGKILNIKNDVLRESLMSFKGVEHRLENVLKIKDVLYINDSKATNVNSSWYALESMKCNVIWIAGGKDKGNDYSPLYNLVKEKVSAIICLGVDNSKLHKEFKDKVDLMIDVESAEEAVQKAYEIAKPGDCVLLSPACASFDRFNNYEQRGKLFKEAVRNL